MLLKKCEFKEPANMTSSLQSTSKFRGAQQVLLQRYLEVVT